VVSIARQIAPHNFDSLPIDSNEAAVISDGEDLQIQELREQLRSLTLRQAAIQERIHASRNALAGLITLFGPGILNSRQCQAAQAGGLFAGTSDRTELCRAVMQESRRWITIPEILDQLRKQSPLSLAQFKNPGSSVSNLLRMLQRQGQVTVRSQNGNREWKWIERGN
jgi:hypothetical protein